MRHAHPATGDASYHEEYVVSATTKAKRGRVQGGCLEGPEAEEGRGERRNVPGELQASDEPGEPEWGNPATCERRQRALNA